MRPLLGALLVLIARISSNGAINIPSLVILKNDQLQYKKAVSFSIHSTEYQIRLCVADIERNTTRHTTTYSHLQAIWRYWLT